MAEQEPGKWARYLWAPYLGLALLLIMLAAIPNLFEPVIRDDPERNIEIPRELMHAMKVKVAYNDQMIFFRFELPAEEPSYYHDYWVYEGDDQWRREGRSPVGQQRYRVYEDRITFFLDDGNVPEFGKWGGFVTVSDREMRFFSEEARGEQVTQVPRFEGQDDVRKWLPETRVDPHDWRTVKADEDLLALQEAGYFLDLWHWRAHRSNPIGWSDDQYILDYRWSDDGRGMYTTNWDEEAGRPLYMFDPELTDQYAMRWEQVVNRQIAQEDYLRYALILGNDQIQGNAIPFDPDHQWQAGDVIPRRLLRVPEGARGAIRANGIYRDGAWLVDLWRDLDTGFPLNDKVLQHKGMYQIAFAAHIRATGSRWHYVSFPFTLGLDRQSDIRAVRFDGDVPPWDDVPWKQITLFYPGQIDWSHLISHAHAGAENIARGDSVWVGHDEETLAQYAVASQFRDEIWAQWRMTLLSLAALIVLIGAGVVIATPRLPLPPEGASQ
jgi:hypothetical protein